MEYIIYISVKSLQHLSYIFGQNILIKTNNTNLEYKVSLIF